MGFGRIMLAAGVVAGALWGCVNDGRDPAMRRALVVLEGGRAATLYSLEPVTSDVRLPRLNGYAVLGTAQLGPADTVRAARQIARGLVVREWSAGCFTPRQALRIAAGGPVYDYLVCDECGRLAVYQDGKQIGSVDYDGPSVALKDLLRREGVPQSETEF